MDVNTFYTNIPIQEGIKCVQKILAKYDDPNRRDQESLELWEINVTRNYFVFNNEFYLQIKGTAMGKRFAPAYANIYKGELGRRGAVQVSYQTRGVPLIFGWYMGYLDRHCWGI